MKFNTAKKLVIAFLVGALVFCVLALALGEETATTFMVGAVLLLIIALFVAFTGLKCPYCGERIIRNVLKLNHCPHCGRNLETGLRSKGKKRR